jgi:hypothetical protein
MNYDYTRLLDTILSERTTSSNANVTLQNDTDTVLNWIVQSSSSIANTVLFEGSEGYYVTNYTAKDTDTQQPCEVCGWIAAFCSMIAFGTFGVPIKSKIAQSVNIDPLVFQSYKTMICFITSWIVLLQGEKFSFTPWGIVSGIFWVPGYVCVFKSIFSQFFRVYCYCC